MSGIDAQRGFICQTYIALIECLDRNDWDTIKLEPGTKKDKIDISLYRDGNTISAIQVKSSRKPLGVKTVLEALDELRRDAEGAESIRLYLVGDKYTEDCSKIIKRTAEIECYPLKNIADICRGKLTDYVVKAGKGKDVNAQQIYNVFYLFFARLHLNSIESGPLSRTDFEKLFLQMVGTKSFIQRVAPVVLAIALVIVGIAVGCHFTSNNKSNSSDLHTGYYSTDVISASSYDPELMSAKFKAAIELYEKAEYKGAKKGFQEAIDEQVPSTAIGNETKAFMYYMLGLASIYSDYSLQSVSDDAVAALTTAKKLYEELQDTWGYMQCCFGLGTAYYEAKSYNKALEICGELLDTITEELENKDTARQVRESGDYGQAVSYRAYDSGDYDSLYAISRASNMRLETLNLMGKLYTETDITAMAYKCFCDALHAGSEGYLADYELILMPTAPDNVDADIRNYIVKLKEQGEIKQSAIESYDYNIEDGTLTGRGPVETYKNNTVATVLTNRAQCGMAEGFLDESEKDCLAALDIWNSLDFSERINLSYTNNTLIMINLSRLSAGAEGSSGEDSEQETLLNKLLGYANESVTYDCELFGMKHWRTAQSYEKRAMVYRLLGDEESAAEDFQRAYDIYVEVGDENGVEMIRGDMDGMQNEG